MRTEHAARVGSSHLRRHHRRRDAGRTPLRACLNPGLGAQALTWLSLPLTRLTLIQPRLGQEIRKFARIRQALDKIPPEALIGGLVLVVGAIVYKVVANKMGIL